VITLEHARCSCLLSPRCFHLLAVVALLEPETAPEASGADLGPVGGATATAAAVAGAAAAAGAGAVAGAGAGAAAAVATVAEKAPPFQLSGSRIEAAQFAWRVGADLLSSGATSAGAVLQAELLRAAHEARGEGMYRLSAAALRAVRGVRALRSEAPEFDLGDYIDDLRELLATAHALGGYDGAPHGGAADFVGEARRAYLPAGDLRVIGLATEPVVAASGYAGVVTYLCDDRARVWTVSDVTPGDAARVRAAYDAPVRMGDTSVAHRKLAREGLFVQGATGSADMRLGAGSGVKAVRAGASSWTDRAARALWDEPLPRQLARAYGALSITASARPAGATLLFVRGRIAGADRDALLLDVGDEPGHGALIRVVAPSDHEELCYLENLRTLAREPGLVVLLVGRIVAEAPRTLAGLAVAPAAEPGSPITLRLPDEWGGRAMLGLDRLQGSHFSQTAPAVSVAEVSEPGVDPLAVYRRRVQRLALGGARCLSPGALTEIATEAAVLEARLLPGAAGSLRSIAAARRKPKSGVDAGALAMAWLRAVTYEARARREVERAGWRMQE
jgi:hypothetical protein